MSVSDLDVRHIASLARLELADGQLPALVRELNDILAHMDVLQAVDMRTAATPMQPGTPTLLRADEPGSVPLARERADFAPSSRDGFFLVPRLSTHE